LKFNNIFSSNMVLAAGKPIKVYGTGCGEGVIHFAGQSRKISSVDDSWCVEFEPMDYSGPHTMQLVSEQDTITLTDIYIGEVFLMAGQSNMQFKLRASTTPKEKYKGDDRIRFFSTKNIEDSDVFKPWDGWQICVLDGVENWSALGYLTAIEYLKHQNVHIGIITCYQGGSIIESWVPEQAFEKAGIPYKLLEKHPDARESVFKDWNDDGKLYNFALSQAIPFTLSGVVWYQGEADTVPIESEIYKDELKELIRIWRNDFNDQNLPFVIIQIADYDLVENYQDWCNVQKGQYEIQFEVENTKTVISADVCESDNIHPPTKDKLAVRVADAINKLLH